MRISIFPKGELDAIVQDRTLSVVEWIAQAAELPIQGVELYSRFFREEEPDLAERVIDALGQYELEMPMLCASPDLAHPVRDVREREFDEHVRMMRLTARIGGAGASCRVLSGQRHPGVDDAQGIEWVVDAFLRLVPVARELNIVLGFENHYKDGFWQYPEFAQRRSVYRAILAEIDERVHFGVQFDPSNAVTAGEDSANFLREVADRVVTMQASDRYLAGGASLDDLRLGDGTIGYSDALRHGVIGQGLNDYPAIFTTLREVGYDGWISVEDGVNGWGEMRESVDFLVAARDEYFGGSTAVSVRSHELARAAAS